MEEIKMPDFYLTSTESDILKQPRKCYIIKKFKAEKREGFLLIKIDPPIIGQNFGLGGNDIDYVALSHRHVGASLFPISEWPLHVFVARLLINPDFVDKLLIKDTQLIAWGEIYKTEEEAQQNK